MNKNIICDMLYCRILTLKDGINLTDKGGREITNRYLAHKFTWKIETSCIAITFHLIENKN